MLLGGGMGRKLLVSPAMEVKFASDGLQAIEKRS
jgi:hypothetical protein